MTIHMQREIDKLKQKVLSLGAIVEETVSSSVKALQTRDAALAQKIVDNDEEIDRMEVETEEDCLKILALHQPVAIDLRFVVAVLKINNDLERIADQAANMAERALFLANQAPVEVPAKLGLMAEKVEDMMKRSLDALVNMNTELAREVIESDDEIDDLNRENFAMFIDRMKNDPESTESAISLLSVSRQLERIADQVTNIAEDVIYMVDGEIVRHRDFT